MPSRDTPVDSSYLTGKSGFNSFFGYRKAIEYKCYIIATSFGRLFFEHKYDGSSAGTVIIVFTWSLHCEVLINRVRKGGEDGFKGSKPTTDYCETKTCVEEAPPAPTLMGWKELYLKEDWWAIYLGIGLMLFTLIAFSHGQ